MLVTTAWGYFIYFTNTNTIPPLPEGKVPILDRQAKANGDLLLSH